MVAISNTTIRQNVFKTIYDLLYNNIGSYGSSSQPTVVASYYEGVQSFPVIVINSPEIGKSNYNFQRSNPNYSVVVNIEIYTKKNKDCDILGDNIDVLMDGSIPGLSIIQKTEDTALSIENDNKIHLKTLSYSFLRK